MSGGEARGNRRSSRILALEEKARLQKQEEKTAAESGEASNSASAASTSTKIQKRGRKRKSLHDVHLGASAIPQEQETSTHEDTGNTNKAAFEFLLDILQSKDTQEIFAQPVDPNEVVGYDDIIKEPMDFGTIRAKLQERMYISLEQFERDVFLIFSNAMRFNSPESVYYKVAEDLNARARRLFNSFRTAPSNFDYIYTGSRQRFLNKASGGSRRGSADPATNRTNQRRQRKPYANQRAGKVVKGLHETERRNTYLLENLRLNQEKPNVTAVCNSPNILMNASDGAIQYSNSLNRFVKDLGPKAKAVADKMLGKQSVEASSIRLGGNGAPIGVQQLPSQMLHHPLSGSSYPVGASCTGAGQPQFTTFLRGVEPRHLTRAGSSGAGAHFPV